MLKVSFVIDHSEQCSEKEFIKEVTREIRIQARRFWRKNNQHVRNRGGRPKLEKAVKKACEIVWKEWGERFPKHNSTARALVQKVSPLVPGRGKMKKDGKARPVRKDLRTIEKYVKEWIDCNLEPTQVPDSWLRRPDGRRAVRVHAPIAAMGLVIRHQGDFSVSREVKRALIDPTDRQLVERLIENRKK